MFFVFGVLSDGSREYVWRDGYEGERKQVFLSRGEAEAVIKGYRALFPEIAFTIEPVSEPDGVVLGVCGSCNTKPAIWRMSFSVGEDEVWCNACVNSRENDWIGCVRQVVAE